MSIFDSFYLLFKADTTDLERGIQKKDKLEAASADKSKKQHQEEQKENKVSVRDMQNLEQQIKKSEDATQGLSLSFVDMAAQAATALAAIVSIGAITGSIFGTEKDVLDIKRFSDLLGLPIEKVGEWEYAIKKFGGSTKIVEGDIKRLAIGLNTMSQFAGLPVDLGVSNLVKDLNANGVQVVDDQKKQVKSVWDVLLLQADVLSKMKDRTSALRLSSQWGNSEEMTLLLEQGRPAIEKFIQQAKDIGVATDKDGDSIQSLVSSLVDLSQAIYSANLHLGPLIDFVNSKENLKQLGESVLIVAGGFVVLAAGLAAFNVTAPIAAIAALTVALVGMGVASLPVLAVAAAIGAVFAAIHYWPQILGGLEKGWDRVWQGMKNVVADTKDQVKGFFDFLDSPSKWYKNHPDFWGKKPKSENEKSNNLVPDGLLHPQSSGKYSDNFRPLPTPAEMMMIAKTSIDVAAKNPLTSQTNTSVQNRASSFAGGSVQIDKIDVVTQATDARGIAADISEFMAKALAPHYSSTTMSVATGQKG